MQTETGLTHIQEQALIHKIRSLSSEKIAFLEDFLDFLMEKEKDAGLVHAANRLSEETFSDIWNNPEDEIYDRL